MRFYSRIEIVELLEVEPGFLDALEREEIILSDASGGAAGGFSERMLERVRVAYNLVHDLDVNLAGVAIIIQMREDMSSLRHQIEGLLNELKGSSTDR
jgi:MerR family transcriptional regulator/heat shock protein HspR